MSVTNLIHQRIISLLHNLEHGVIYPMRFKNVNENKALEKLLHFNYLGRHLTYKDDRDIAIKINTFQKSAIQFQ